MSERKSNSKNDSMLRQKRHLISRQGFSAPATHEDLFKTRISARTTRATDTDPQLESLPWLCVKHTSQVNIMCSQILILYHPHC